ncbi:MAG: hypothetical protein JXJ20_09365 [Anaerolineae bacterium]|jgi:hypothetical protein|nr:hypothetical protein [Anaerolineae bacterium]
MFEELRDRLTGWGARLSFGALLLVFSEWVVWQTPTEYDLLEWGALAAIYLALAAVMLDLIARFNASDIFSLLLVAGIYGLINATLISHITTRDLPLSLIMRPLSAQPLAFLGALAAFQVLASGRATGPFDFVIALGVGLVWGVWVRWFPVTSEESIPTVDIGPALLALLIGLLACALIRYLVPRAAIYRREDWQLLPAEWWIVGGVLAFTAVIGNYQGYITNAGLALAGLLAGFMVITLYTTLPMRRDAFYLASVTPPRRPNPAAWLILIIPFLLAGWIGYSLPGSGDQSPQSDLLFGALMGFGIVWLPAVSTVIGVRAFIQLAREEG